MQGSPSWVAVQKRGIGGGNSFMEIEKPVGFWNRNEIIGFGL